MDVNRCLVCGKPAPPMARRMIHPPSPSNRAARNFYSRFINPSFVFPESMSLEVALYACKKPCYAKMESAMSKVVATESIITELCGPTVDATLSLCAGTRRPGGAALTGTSDSSTQTEIAAVTPLVRREVPDTSSSDSVPSQHRTPFSKRRATIGQATRREARTTSLLGKHKLPAAESVTSRAKRLKVLPPVLLFPGDQDRENPTTLVSIPPAVHPEQSSSQQEVVPSTPASRQHRAPPQSLIKVQTII